MQKLVVAFPMYRHLSVSWFFQWLQMDKRSVSAAVGTDGVYLPQAMENLVKLAFKHCPDFDRLVIYEHDMLPPLDAFERIAGYGDEHDIVGTVYFKHSPPHEVTTYVRTQSGDYTALHPDTVRTYVNNPDLYEVDAVAMGLTAIRRQVFENWDSTVPMWIPSPPLVGHDLHFCNEAKKQGFRVWVDSAIGAGHLTTVPIGHTHYIEAQERAAKPAFQKRCDRWQQRSLLNAGGAAEGFLLHTVEQ